MPSLLQPALPFPEALRRDQENVVAGDGMPAGSRRPGLDHRPSPCQCRGPGLDDGPLRRVSCARAAFAGDPLSGDWHLPGALAGSAPAQPVQLQFDLAA